MRRKRSYQPGAAFHITARTNGKEHWLDDGVRDALVDIIATTFARCDARLIAFAIMSNHFHLVLWQGVMTLGQVVQPITRRLALLLGRKLARTGRLLERRYYDVQCVDANHLREAIVYTHLNPVAAGMCGRSADYAWSSQRSYAAGATSVLPRLAIELDLFARNELRSLEQLREDYISYEDWRAICRATPEDQPKPPQPMVRGGDAYWANSVGARASCALTGAPSTQVDLRDLVRRTVAQLAPDMSLDMVYAGHRAPMIVKVRHSVVVQATRAGYSVAKISRHMHMSESVVSRIACATSGRPPVLFR
jgi:REP element-mobilizing transposase RayT